MKLNVFTSMRLDESALMEVCGVIVARLPVIYKKLLVSDLCPPSGVSKIYTHLKKGKRGIWRALEVSPTLDPRKITECALWEIISGHEKTRI